MFVAEVTDSNTTSHAPCLHANFSRLRSTQDIVIDCSLLLGVFNKDREAKTLQ